MLATGKDADNFITAEDTASIDDETLKNICLEAINANPKAVNDYLNGKTKAIKSILGFVMQKTKGKANALNVEKNLINLIDKN